jgi:mxaK protein
VRLNIGNISLVPWRGPLLWLIAALALAVFAVALANFLGTRRTNETIRSLMVLHKDVKIDANSAAPEAILARLNELIRRDRIDDAQALLGRAAMRLPPDVRALTLYNMANARTRRAGELVRKGDIDGAAALVNVAKSEYRLALKINPDDWDTKFNLDVAMRIVRDLPQAEIVPDEAPENPKQIWTDLPGVPKGLP